MCKTFETFQPLCPELWLPLLPPPPAVDQAAPNYAIVKNNLAIALTDLGTKIKVQGQVQEGIAMYERALALNPKHAGEAEAVAYAMQAFVLLGAVLSTQTQYTGCSWMLRQPYALLLMSDAGLSNQLFARLVNIAD